MKKIATLLLLGVFAASAPADHNWPRFRGPNGAGRGVAQGLAEEWSTANTLWSVTLPGSGHSSPVVWQDKLFVTAHDAEAGACVLLAYEAATGKPLWERAKPAGKYPMHASNNPAATTPAVDARGVYVSRATPDEVWVDSYSHAGEHRWERSLGPFASSHGFASSPVVVDGVVCLAGDQMEESSVVGLGAHSGEIKWRMPRPGGKAAYSTPCVIEMSGKQEGKNAIVVQSMAAGMAAIDISTGKELWRLPDIFPARCVSSPVASDGLVLGACGGGGSGKQLVAVELGDSSREPSEAYRLTKSVPYVPTPLVVDDMVFLWHDRGTVACVDLQSGAKLWEQRIGGKFFSSPVCLGDAVLCISMEGEAVTIAVDRTECRILARNKLDQPTQATPAVAHGRLYIRTESELMCIGSVQTALKP